MKIKIQGNYSLGIRTEFHGPQSDCSREWRWSQVIGVALHQVDLPLYFGADFSHWSVYVFVFFKNCRDTCSAVTCCYQTEYYEEESHHSYNNKNISLSRVIKRTRFHSEVWIQCWFRGRDVFSGGGREFFRKPTSGYCVGVKGIVARSDNKASSVRAVILHPAWSRAMETCRLLHDPRARPVLLGSTSGQEDVFNTKGWGDMVIAWALQEVTHPVQMTVNCSHPESTACWPGAQQCWLLPSQSPHPQGFSAKGEWNFSFTSASFFLLQLQTVPAITSVSEVQIMLIFCWRQEKGLIRALGPLFTDPAI